MTNKSLWWRNYRIWRGAAVACALIPTLPWWLAAAASLPVAVLFNVIDLVIVRREKNRGSLPEARALSLPEMTESSTVPTHGIPKLELVPLETTESTITRIQRLTVEGQRQAESKARVFWNEMALIKIESAAKSGKESVIVEIPREHSALAQRVSDIADNEGFSAKLVHLEEKFATTLPVELHLGWRYLIPGTGLPGTGRARKG